MSQEKAKIRLYVREPLGPGAQLMLPMQQSHYLSQVMRCGVGDAILLFNGEDGEWIATITRQDKRHAYVQLGGKVREQEMGPDLWLLFAPIKGKTDIVVEKAVELGASRIIPVITQRTIVRSINMEKLEIHAAEAAEQCGRLDVPVIEQAIELPNILGNWPAGRVLLYADERGSGQPLKGVMSGNLPEAKAVLVGPEGGFSPEEQQVLNTQNFVRAFSMGARILRADTASVAALACVQALAGDWEKQPEFEA